MSIRNFLNNDHFRVSDWITEMGDDTFWRSTSCRLSYRKFFARVAGVIAQLQLMNVGPRQKIALYVTDAQTMLIYFFAAWLSDFSVVLINRRYPLRVLSQFQRNVGFQFIVSDIAIDVTCFEATLTQLKLNLDVFDHSIDFKSMKMSEEIAVIFTSGSSLKEEGHPCPKGVSLSGNNFFYSALGSNDFLGAERNDRFLLSLPLYHVGGLLIAVRSFLCGGICSVVESSLATTIASEKPHFISLVATQLQRLVDQQSLDWQSCKTVLIGGGPVHGKLLRKAINAGMPVRVTYGSTESCAQLTCTRILAHDAIDGLDDFRCAGETLPFRSVSITSGGRIRFGGLTRFLGYYRDGSIQENADDFFITNDYGRLTAQGLWVDGRSDDCFISGGENIDPRIVENVYYRRASVLFVSVFALDDCEFGMVPAAIVISQESNIALQEFARQHLPGFMVPKRVKYINLDDLPMQDKSAGWQQQLFFGDVGS